MSKIALVTGSNKGIGLQVVRELAAKNHKVLLTARDEGRGKAAIAELAKDGLEVDFQQLDVSDASSIKTSVAAVAERHGKIDILVNNAGILISDKQSLFEIDTADIDKTLLTNVHGPLRMMQAVVPVMKKNNYGRIVNISSGMGQLSDMNGGYVSYRLSKVSLNALTRIAADEIGSDNILVNTMCPGWVRTEMGGQSATRDVKEGADTAIYLAELPDGGPSGKFFRDRKEIPW